VAFLVNHKGLSMARTVGRGGEPPTLTLDSDPRGLHARAYVNPDRNDVHDLLCAIDDGVVTEMSFAFMIDDGEWSEDYEHYEILRVNIDRGDVSAVNFGANPYTSIEARSREILRDLERLPDAAQRAAWNRLCRRFGGMTETRQAAAAAARDLDPVAAAASGKSVEFYETMLRL